VLLEGEPVLAVQQERRADARGLALDRLQRLVRLGADHGGDAGLEDARLLTGDRGQGVAEEALMVVVDRGDGAERGPFDQVGRVEPAAEPDLQQQRVGGMTGEGKEGGGSGDLEERDRRAVVRDGRAAPAGVRSCRARGR
jgi:hypothetical protein